MTDDRQSLRRVREADATHDLEFQRTIELIGARWTGSILAALLDRGKSTHGELVGAIPLLSRRMLDRRLKTLIQAGLVERSVTTARPVRVTYRLTAYGRAVISPVRHAIRTMLDELVAPE